MDIHSRSSFLTDFSSAKINENSIMEDSKACLFKSTFNAWVKAGSCLCSPFSNLSSNAIRSETLLFLKSKACFFCNSKISMFNIIFCYSCSRMFFVSCSVGSSVVSSSFTYHPSKFGCPASDQALNHKQPKE